MLCSNQPADRQSRAGPYAYMTEALGFVPLRHEGKLTGLAGFGEPVLADKLAARFSVNQSGRVFLQFRQSPSR